MVISQFLIMEKMDIKKIQQFEPHLGEEEKQQLIEVIDSGWFTEAKKTREFEKIFAEYVGKKYAVATTSGTSALFIALYAMNLSRNDQVIVPDLTFVASPNSVKMAGAKISFVDIEKNNLCLDIKKTKKMFNKNTRAVMPVDFNGRTADIRELRENTDKSNIFIVEDACHTMGSYYRGKHMGHFSDVSIVSFATPKIITTGQGGMLVTDNKELYEKYRMIKDFGRYVDKKHNMRKAFEHVIIGFNFKFTEFQAAVGIAQMKKLSKRVEHKKNMFKIYRDILEKVRGIEFLETNLDEIVPWFNDIFLPSNKVRDNLIEHLNNHKIGTRIIYPPIHKLKPYSNSKTNFVNTDEMSKRGLWLPSSSFLTDDDIIFISDKIKNFMQEE